MRDWKLREAQEIPPDDSIGSVAKWELERRPVRPQTMGWETLLCGRMETLPKMQNSRQTHSNATVMNKV